MRGENIFYGLLKIIFIISVIGFFIVPIFMFIFNKFPPVRISWTAFILLILSQLFLFKSSLHNFIIMKNADLNKDSKLDTKELKILFEKLKNLKSRSSKIILYQIEKFLALNKKPDHKKQITAMKNIFKIELISILFTFIINVYFFSYVLSFISSPLSLRITAVAYLLIQILSGLFFENITRKKLKR